jgi:hypothetical protein
VERYRREAVVGTPLRAPVVLDWTAIIAILRPTLPRIDRIEQRPNPTRPDQTGQPPPPPSRGRLAPPRPDPTRRSPSRNKPSHHRPNQSDPAGQTALQASQKFRKRATDALKQSLSRTPNSR